MQIIESTERQRLMESVGFTFNGRINPDGVPVKGVYSYEGKEVVGIGVLMTLSDSAFARFIGHYDPSQETVIMRAIAALRENEAASIHSRSEG